MANDSAKPKVNIDVNPDTTPILYTDNVIISSNPMGMVIEVCQRVGPNRLKIVSRIGMSREHAKKMVDELGKNLAITETAPEKN